MANDDDQPATLRAFDLTNLVAPKADEGVDDDGALDEHDGHHSDEPGGSPR